MQREFALPGTRARYPRDRSFDIEHIDLDLELDLEARTVSGRCSLTVTPLADGARWLELDAVELDIHTVRCGSEDHHFRHDGLLLRVDVGEHRPGGQSFTLDVTYSGRPRRGLYFIHPDEGYPHKPVQVWSQGQDEDSRYWFPCFDSPNEKATSEVRVTLPAELFALSNGTLQSDTTEGDRRTLHWRFDVPHSCYLITLVAGHFSEQTDRWNEVELAYYVERGREEACQRTVARTPQMLELFSDLFGVRYPYRRYSQVFVADFIFGGMENTTATTLADVVLLDERATIDFDMDSLIAHELAHQWFGDLITCRDWSEGWLNEGFATYAEYLWRYHHEGADAAAVELQSFADHYFGEDSSRYRRVLATKHYDDPIDIFDAHLYEKGARVLHMLRRELGDEAFWDAIRHYLTKHRGGSVETRDLLRAIEDATGRALDWFFEQWVTESHGHPELTVDFRWDPEARLGELTVSQTQKVEGRTPLFRLPTQLRFRTAAGDVELPLEVVEQTQTFFLPLFDEPQQAIFDPGKHLLAHVVTTKSLPLWIAELGNATEAIDRAHAATALGKLGGPRAEAALVAAMTSDDFWAVRAAAAEALSRVRTPTARDALIAALGATQHPKARRGVARALGAFRHDERAAAALASALAHGDSSYFVEAELCISLGKTRSPRAAELLRAASNRESFTDVIRSSAYRGLAEARDDSAIELLIDASRYGRNAPHGRRAAISALAQLVRGRRDHAAVVVREHVEELLHDADFRVQAAAIEALATIGDPAAAPAINALIARALDGRLRRRGREVVRDLDAAQPAGEQLQTVRDHLETMQTELRQVRERMARAEAELEQLRRRKSKKKKSKK